MASESMWVSDRDMPAECARLATERDNWQQRAEVVEQTMQGMAAEIQGLTAERDAARAEAAIVIGERDRARIDANYWRLQAEALTRKADALVAQRDTAQAEAEGLRADLLAHPPEVHQELAAERQRHVELKEDYDRREVVITTLEDALKRAEIALKTAQGRHIDHRLKGFLAVISQLADQSQDLLP